MSKNGWTRSKAPLGHPNGSLIAPDLNYPFAEARIISREYALYRSVVLNSADGAVHRIRMAIHGGMEGVVDDTTLDLVAMIDAIYNTAESVSKKYLSPFSPARLKAMMIYEIYTHHKT